MPSKSVSFRLLFAAILMTGLGTACSGSDTNDAIVTPAATTAAAATAEDNPCAAAQPEIEAGSKATGFVDSVEVESCDNATVKTTLGNTPDDAQSALASCSIAANEASSHGVKAVTVVSSDGTELARGTNSDDCAVVS